MDTMTLADKLKACAEDIEKEKRDEKKRAAESEELQELTRLDALLESGKLDLDAFEQESRRRASLPKKSTGFRSLDKVLCGGFTEGLCVVLGESGTGKTAFCLQLSRHFAKDGFPVLYIALEQDKHTLTGRALASACAEQTPRGKLSPDISEGSRLCPSVSDLLEAHPLTDAQKATLEKAKDELNEVRDRLKVVDAEPLELACSDILKLSEHFCKSNKGRAVVVIDYLQNLASLAEQEGSASDFRQTLNKLIMCLHKIAIRDRALFVLPSATSRQSYGKKLDKGSGKESGEIEYKAEHLLTLEHREEGEGRCAELQGTRALSQRLLKNRNGAEDADGWELIFCPSFCYFYEEPCDTSRATSGGVDRGQDEHWTEFF